MSTKLRMADAKCESIQGDYDKVMEELIIIKSINENQQKLQVAKSESKEIQTEVEVQSVKIEARGSSVDYGFDQLNFTNLKKSEPAKTPLCKTDRGAYTRAKKFGKKFSGSARNILKDRRISTARHKKSMSPIRQIITNLKRVSNRRFTHQDKELFTSKDLVRMKKGFVNNKYHKTAFLEFKKRKKSVPLSKIIPQPYNKPTSIKPKHRAKKSRQNSLTQMLSSRKYSKAAKKKSKMPPKPSEAQNFLKKLTGQQTPRGSSKVGRGFNLVKSGKKRPRDLRKFVSPTK